MHDVDFETRVVTRGRQFFGSIQGEAPSVFNKGFWTGKVMDWAMRNEDFKVQLFRFVDVLPYLNTSESLQRHIEEYFSGQGSGDIPAVLKWGAEKSGGGLFGSFAAKAMGKIIRSNIEGMARQFIIGQNTKEAIASLQKMRKDGFAFTVDLLGEATVSEPEAQAYMDGYMELLDALAKVQSSWKPLASPGGASPDLDWGHTPRLNVSIKPSALYSQAKAVDVEDTVQGILSRLRPIYAKVKELGGALCIDMESLKFKEATLELFKRLRAEPEFRDYPHLSIVLQSYLRCTDEDLRALIDWTTTQNLPIGIRLVKGAYWDQETIVAVQNGWPVPVWTKKPETDAAFERHARMILEQHKLIYFQCGSHNIRSIAMVMETAKDLGVAPERYEFQVLYGMAEPVRKGLKNVADRVRLYCPYGELLPGMAYLVRRLLENTANESFLKQSFADQADMDRLLENPLTTLERDNSGTVSPRPAMPGTSTGKPLNASGFKNMSLVDFTVPEARSAFPEAIAAVRGQKGKNWPLFIGGKDVPTQDLIASYNPADPDEILGQVCQAGREEVDQALDAARKALPGWRDTSPEERARFLFKAADVCRRRVFELSAWQVLEVGKQWDQAYNDVAEAVDFLEYYAREMIRLGVPRRMGNAPGEVNELFYQPKGIAAVIAPWNFPFAISMGMVSAAIVTGNPVIYKPSSLSSLVGYGLVEVFREIGLPQGVFNYCPGRSRVMGDYLVEHPDVSVIAFTGSVEVGLRIIEKAAKVHPGQDQCKRVIAEMGGKNAIIIDDDADLDEAVPQVLYSAFGFQGQKCSACSRVIVLDAIYERFMTRLREAALSVKIGPSEHPGNYMGPVVDLGQQKNVQAAIETASQEGRIVVQREVPEKGCFVPLTIVEGIRPEHRTAQEEIFGPVLAVMRAKDFTEALDMANNSRFALTGGVFSRSPKRLEQAKREFRVGNLYLNRNNTGALVYRQPFGGFKMSGVGSKAGGPDYLIQFLDPRVVTENTMRRGFAPIAGDDEWVG
ncbi:L-glutamate gamma-semialdehyde dehydrogenase [Desulfonatronum thioautotrophicum]|uniref:L-glutamate gamma-semialdehyde dehydrogenase n=1 Tax=Desulfonatronum thioautotrophicum TaxID=617001 RepID=UPI0005EB6A6C|nr:L-glutamate gamma-semialdehyde dehydrogenase [Desulfonatronum thioautotrophicum]